MEKIKLLRILITLFLSFSTCISYAETHMDWWRDYPKEEKEKMSISDRASMEKIMTELDDIARHINDESIAIANNYDKLSQNILNAGRQQTNEEWAEEIANNSMEKLYSDSEESINNRKNAEDLAKTSKQKLFDTNDPESKSNLEHAETLHNQSKEIFLDSIKDTLSAPNIDPAIREQALKPRSALQVFISAAMPIELLKKYAKEAKKYGASLVLQGLPNGSMRDFISFASSISSADSTGLQIDDEAFTAFKVDKVPAIVLTQPISIVDSKNHKAKFDKISGCVSIKSALEQFMDNGEMSNEARGLLQ